jgi:hypothetical protein
MKRSVDGQQRPQGLRELRKLNFSSPWKLELAVAAAMQAS